MLEAEQGCEEGSYESDAGRTTESIVSSPDVVGIAWREIARTLSTTENPGRVLVILAGNRASII